MKKILLADDQIPDDKFKTNNEILEKYRKVWNEEHKVWEDDLNFANGFVFMKKMIGVLRDDGYDVTIVNKAKEIIPAVKKRKVDCVVLDLGWYLEYSLGYDEKMSLGWTIAENIQEITPSTPIIMFSNRFPGRNDLVETAAEKHLLPIFKEEDDTCIKSLQVAIKYSITRGGDVKDIINEKKKTFNFEMYKTLCTVLIISIIVMSGAILGSLFLSISNVPNKSQLSIITGTISAGSTFLNLIIYSYIKRFNK